MSAGLDMSGKVAPVTGVSSATSVTLDVREGGSVVDAFDQIGRSIGLVDVVIDRLTFSKPICAATWLVMQRRLGSASDLDAPLLLLASDAAPFMTGAVVAVDGGHLVSTL